MSCVSKRYAYLIRKVVVWLCVFNSQVNELVLHTGRGVWCFRLHLSKPFTKQMPNAITKSVVVWKVWQEHIKRSVVTPI